MHNGNQLPPKIDTFKFYHKIKQSSTDYVSLNTYNMLTKDKKRFYQMDLTRKGNYSLNQVAKKCRCEKF